VTLSPGTLVAERYRVDRLLARGGARGAVYAAADTRDGAALALEVASPLADEFEVLRTRFRRDATVGRALEPWPARLLCARDWGEHAVDSLYRVVDLVEGARGLDLRTGPRAERLARLLEAVELVQSIHVRGVVHRGLRPASFLVGADGRIWLRDFGLARLEAEGVESESTRLHVTQAALTAGLAHYMAPEQIDARPADARADVFSLGVMVFEALGGALPFGGDLTELLRQREQVRLGAAPAPRPGDGSAPPPPELEAACLEAMVLEPDERPQGLAGLAAALRAAVAEAEGGDRAGAEPRSQGRFSKAALEERLEDGSADAADAAAGEGASESDIGLVSDVGLVDVGRAAAGDEAPTAEPEGSPAPAGPPSAGGRRPTPRPGPAPAGGRRPTPRPGPAPRRPTGARRGSKGPTARPRPGADGAGGPRPRRSSGRPLPGRREGPPPRRPAPAGDPRSAPAGAGEEVVAGRRRPPAEPRPRPRPHPHPHPHPHPRPRPRLRPRPRPRPRPGPPPRRPLPEGFPALPRVAEPDLVDEWGPVDGPGDLAVEPPSARFATRDLERPQRAPRPRGSDGAASRRVSPAVRRLLDRAQALLDREGEGVSRRGPELKAFTGDPPVGYSLLAPDPEARFAFLEQRVTFDPEALEGRPTGRANLLLAANAITHYARGLRCVVTDDRLRFRREVWLPELPEELTAEGLERDRDLLLGAWAEVFQPLRAVQQGTPWHVALATLLAPRGAPREERIQEVEDVLGDLERSRAGGRLTVWLDDDPDAGMDVSASEDVEVAVLVRPWMPELEEAQAVKEGRSAPRVEALLEELNARNAESVYALSWDPRRGVVARTYLSGPLTRPRLLRCLDELRAARDREPLESLG